MKTHRMTNSPTHKSWSNMKNRCLNPSTPAYPRYGGRGITIDATWIENFSAFLADMGERPAGTTLDRIDNNGGYYKENCRWATVKAQNNNRRSNRYVTYSGRTLTVAQWSAELGINNQTLRHRLFKKNLLPALAFTWKLNTKKTECTNGHPLSGDNVYTPPGSNTRHCRTCVLNNKRRYRERQRSKGAA